MNYFTPMAAAYNQATDTLNVYFIGNEKQHYPNREEAEKALGFPCNYSASDYKNFRKSGTTIIRTDLGGKVINRK
jgi:hypothetical protein